MEYKIISQKEAFFERVVGDMMVKGWTPLGGVSVIRRGMGEHRYNVYNQAMVKNEKRSDDELESLKFAVNKIFSKLNQIETVMETLCDRVEKLTK
jgi:hypothetical protein